MSYEVTNDDLEIANRSFGLIEAYLGSPWDGRDIPALDLGHNLLTSILREYQHLKLGYEKDTPLEAWACRNLLELDIYVKYVLISETSARRFVGDVTIDGIELFESMKEWMTALAPTIKILALDETLRLAYERKTSEGVIESKHLEIRDLAEEVGMTADYRHTNRLCSKLVHPTAWSVLSMNDDGEYAAFRPLLFNAGVRYGVDGFNMIRQYAEQLGGG